MIQLCKLNHEEIWLNPLLVEAVAAHPDCVVTMSNGHKYVVRESPAEIAVLMRTYFQGLSVRIAAECSVLPAEDVENP